MEEDYMIHIPARKRAKHEGEGCVVRISAEAYNTLVDIFNESALSMSQIASLIIMQSASRIVYDREDE